MEQYYVAESYKNAERIGEPFEKDGKLYITVREVCDRCGGSGIYAIGVKNGMLVPHPAYAGVCLKCGGCGKTKRDVRLYTEKEHERQLRAKELREKRKAEKEKERQQKLLEQSEENKKEWFKKNGFDENGFTYCVFGDDTYSIKDWLKEQGCKFSPLLKWHCAEPLDVPVGYGMIGFSFEDIYIWDPEEKNAFFKENAEYLIEKRFREAEGPSLSEYFGIIGERYYNLTVIYKSCRGFESRYGWTNIYTFNFGNDVFVWFTQKNLDLEKGCAVDFTGTVKNYEEFRGVKTTQFSRCIIKKLEE